jgi:hypothetical protein
MTTQICSKNYLRNEKAQKSGDIASQNRVRTFGTPCMTKSWQKVVKKLVRILKRVGGEEEGDL